jgi:hypothetical protein
MAANTPETKQHAHALIDRLPPTQLAALVDLLETMLDPVESALRKAEIDDEPESAEEKKSVQEAHNWLRAHGGKGIPHEEAMERLGLK